MQCIERSFNGPTIFDDTIEDGCFFENTMIGMGTIIIDQEFIDEMEKLATPLMGNKSLTDVTTKIYNAILKYYTSDNVNEDDRRDTYSKNLVIGEDGMVLGTRLSALKGKNIAVCSEKSIAAYVILNKFFRDGGTKRKPELVLSYLSTEDSKEEPHAFVMMNKEDDEKVPHILFDVENPTELVDKDGNNCYWVGLYSLTPEEYENFRNGKTVNPKSLYELFGYQETGAKRTYGSDKKGLEL